MDSALRRVGVTDIKPGGHFSAIGKRRDGTTVAIGFTNGKPTDRHQRAMRVKGKGLLVWIDKQAVKTTRVR